MTKYLYSPWRMSYIESVKESGCVFCLPQTGEKDSERMVLYRSTHSFVIMNLYPYNNGHVMVVPFRHISDLSELSAEESNDFFALVKKTSHIIQQAYHPDGINLGMNIGSAAGAGIAEHIHMHLVPRWNGDVNFMTSTGSTRVIPEDFEQSYNRLKEQFDKHDE